MEAATISRPDSMAPLTERRSEPRTSMAIDVVLRGSDTSGKAFFEKTQTVNISRTGAKTLTAHALNHGSRLQVAIPRLKRSSWATVAWIGEKNGNLQEIGIAVDETIDFWGGELSDEAGERPTVPPEEHKQESESAVPESPQESPDKLSILLQELAQKAIEHSLEEALRQMSQRALELKTIQESLTKDTEERLSQLVQNSLKRVEDTASEAASHTKQACEQSIQVVADAARKQLEAQVTEHQGSLLASASQVRRELGRKFSEFGSVFGAE